jgi:hypothetical protein
VAKFADAAPESVTLLTGHRYAEGPPSDPGVTLDRLLAPNPSFIHRMAETEEISRSARIPYVMAETNSCFKAGKAGVSDVFGAALWAVDYMLQLAKSLERGVYFHGGANGWYTPIADGSGKPFEARPIYYGLEMCRSQLGANWLPRMSQETPPMFLYMPCGIHGGLWSSTKERRKRAFV